MGNRLVPACRNSRRLLLTFWAIVFCSVAAACAPVTRAPESSYPATAAPAPPPAVLNAASFNIQFLGQFRSRNNGALARLLAPYDLVLVQELVAPPYAGTFPDGSAYRPDPEAAAFFDAMRRLGFQYVLSEEDTGTGSQSHVNSSATEWYVAFYRPTRISPAPDLVTGFLAEDRYDHPDFERVPYAFGFRSGTEDLVFISVHLQPGPGSADARRRAHELRSILSWIEARRGPEMDFVILGDMNIESCAELAQVLPAGHISLNSGCQATNTNVNGPKPYDHIIYRWAYTSSEIPARFSVIDLIEAMRPGWAGEGAYPGQPYDHDRFRQIYSDHHPIAFQIIVDGIDDDPSRP